jgi:hypothetical protein
MAKALITSPFPSTAEVARKLSLPGSRIRRVAALLGSSVFAYRPSLWIKVYSCGMADQGGAPVLQSALARPLRFTLFARFVAN